MWGLDERFKVNFRLDLSVVNRVIGEAHLVELSLMSKSQSFVDTHVSLVDPFVKLMVQVLRKVVLCILKF